MDTDNTDIDKLISFLDFDLIAKLFNIANFRVKKVTAKDIRGTARELLIRVRDEAASSHCKGHRSVSGPYGLSARCDTYEYPAKLQIKWAPASFESEIKVRL